MKMKEFCRQYAVTKDVIKAFLHAGLLKALKMIWKGIVFAVSLYSDWKPVCVCMHWALIYKR